MILRSYNVPGTGTGGRQSPILTRGLAMSAMTVAIVIVYHYLLLF